METTFATVRNGQQPTSGFSAISWWRKRKVCYVLDCSEKKYFCTFILPHKRNWQKIFLHLMKKFMSVVTLAFVVLGAFAQQAYFADGYHGGIYGHYPLWKTKFMVDKFHQHPEWKIGLEIEPETWDTVKLRTPEDYRLLQQIIADKRIEITNPAYAQPYAYNTSGESLIRQFEYGIRKTREHFPGVQFTTYSVEEPCFTSCLPQILKLFGFKYAVLKNPDTCWGGYTSAYGGELVNWTGPDGTTILTVPRYACEEFEENSTWQTKAWNNSKSFLDACFQYGIKNPAGMCYQDAGWRGGPWIGHGDNIKNGSVYITWTDYIENISIGKTDDDWRFSQEDVLVSLMWGSQALQRIAQQVRRAENDIVMAEKMSVISNLENGWLPLQEEIDEAWRTLMMAQHHDSWIVPYNRLFRQRTWAQQIELWTGTTSDISDKLIQTAMQSFGSGTNPHYIRIYNTLGVNRNEIIMVSLSSDYSGKELEVFDFAGKKISSWTKAGNDGVQLYFKANVKSFGYTTYRFAETKSRRNKANSGIRFVGDECILENDMYQIVIDASKGGVIKKLIAKKEGNRDFAVRDGKYQMGELRGHFYEEERFHSSTDAPAKITILDDHPLKISVKVEGTIAAHPFTQTITIAQGQKRIDFDLTIDWKENTGIGEYRQPKDSWRENRRAFYDSRFKLNVLFPANLESPKLYKNAPFDVCESRLENTFFNTWDNIKHNIILNWVDLVQSDEKYGLALLSDHTTSYSFGSDFPLGLTAQYSGFGLWGVDYKITQPLKMKFAIVPHKGKWDDAAISAESNVWNEPLIYSLHRDVGQKTNSLIDADNTGYEITAARMNDNGIIVRLFNADGNHLPQKITFNFPFSRIDEVDLNGQVISENVSVNKTITVSMPRFGIKTYKLIKH